MTFMKRFRHALNRLSFGEESYRRSLRIPSDWPDPLNIRVATREEELEAAFRLLHDNAVASGRMKKQESGMTMLPHHLLPQTTVIIATWNGEIAAAASLIRENPLGLPLEKDFPLARHRKGGKRLGEISSFALSPNLQWADHPSDPQARIFLPFFRYLYHYSTRCFGIQKLVMSVVPESAAFYRAVLLFQLLGPLKENHAPFNGHPAAGLILDLERAPLLWKEIYEDRPEAGNLLNYIRSMPESSVCELPPRPYNLVSDWVMTPRMLNRLFFEKANIQNSLRPNELRVLREIYPDERFHSILNRGRFHVDRKPGRELRLDAHMRAEMDIEPIALDVRNVSRHGLQLWSPERLPNDTVISLHVWINATQCAQLKAQVKWSDPSGYHGLRILSYETEWAELANAIESHFGKLAAA